VALAGASAWIHFRAPHLWDDQAILYSTMTGTAIASFTAIFLGLSMLFAVESRGRTLFINLFLTLLFAAAQGYLLWLTGKDMGIIQLIKSRLG